jgi:hypothetical protein
MNYEHPKNEPESLSADEQKLREFCCSLEKVEAPKDFDFKVKARIANAKPRDFQPRFAFALRYAVPALALILVFGLLAYNSGIWSSNDKPFVVENQNAPPNPILPPNGAAVNFSTPEQTTNSNSTVLPATPNSLKVPENELAAGNSKSPKAAKKRELKNDNFNGSGTSTFRIAEVIQPKGFEQKTLVQNPQNDEKENPMPVKEVFSQMGINADFENGKWRVKSVTANSVGESSGVKENDIIEAIDDQPLTAETVFNKTAGGKSITVTRNGEKSQIRLRNKQ